MSEYEGKIPYRKRNKITLIEFLYYEATGENMPIEEKEIINEMKENEE